MKFRKIPIVVDAWEWSPEKPVEGVLTPLSSQDARALGVHESQRKVHGLIKTHSGKHLVSPGDWIVQGVKKEKYPVQRDVFKETFEPLKDLPGESVKHQPPPAKETKQESAPK